MYSKLKQWLYCLLVSSRVYHGSVYLALMFAEKQYLQRKQVILVNGTAGSFKTEFLLSLLRQIMFSNPNTLWTNWAGDKRNIFITTKDTGEVIRNRMIERPAIYGKGLGKDVFNRKSIDNKVD